MASVGLVLARKTTSAPRDVVWSYFSNAHLRRQWWAGSHIDMRLGGTVTEKWSEGDGADANVRHAVGAIDVCIEGHAFGYRWRDQTDEFETEVLVTLRTGDDGTDVTVTETGFGRFADAHERVADAQQGWIDLLDGLIAALGAAPAAEEVDAEAPTSGEESTSETASSEDQASSEEIQRESSPEAQSSSEASPEPEPEPELEVEAEPELEVEAEPEEEPAEMPEPSFDSLIRGTSSDS